MARESWWRGMKLVARHKVGGEGELVAERVGGEV